MPTYDFRCEDCGRDKEVFDVACDDFTVRPCPCGGNMIRQFPAPGVSCWFVDYRQMDGEREFIDQGGYE